MNINAKVDEIIQRAKQVLSQDAQNDKDGTTIPIGDFRTFISKLKELVDNVIPWYLK